MPEIAETKDYTPQAPKQVRDQVVAAEKMMADIKSAEGSASTPPDDAGPPSPPVGQQPETPPMASGGDGEETWEQRARSAQGRLEQAARANQALSDRVNQLESMVNTMRIKGSEPAEPAQPTPRQPPKLVTEDEARDYGDEFLTVVGKRAKEVYAPEFDELADRLKRLEGRVEGVGTVIEKTQVNDVYGTLAGVVPNWRDVNRSEGFKAWLQHPDPFSGRRRHDMLMEAFSGHDAGRVVAFFKGFLTEAAGPPPNQPSSGSAPPLASNGNGSGRPSLEDFAAPGRARSGPQQLPPDKPVYSSAWIAKFMADKQRGKYRGREADADAIERDIYLAQHEGRIH